MSAEIEVLLADHDPLRLARRLMPELEDGVVHWVASALASLHGANYQPNNMRRLIGSEQIVARIQQGEDPAAITARWSADEARWRRLRAKHLLYR